jgi:hypothetical protein
LFHPFGFGFEQILTNLRFWAPSFFLWRQMLYLPDEYSTRVLAHAKKSGVVFPCGKRLSRQYNAVIKFHDFKGLRMVRRGLARQETARGTP